MKLTENQNLLHANNIPNRVTSPAKFKLRLQWWEIELIVPPSGARLLPRIIAFYDLASNRIRSQVMKFYHNPGLGPSKVMCGDTCRQETFGRLRTQKFGLGIQRNTRCQVSPRHGMAS